MTDDAGVPDAAPAQPTEPVTPAAAPAAAAAPAPPPEKPSWWRRTTAVSVFAMVWIAIVLLVGGFLIGRYVHVGDDGGHHRGRFGRGGYEFRGPMAPGYRFGPGHGGECMVPNGDQRMRGPNGGMQVMPCAPVPQAPGAPAAPTPTTVAPSTSTTVAPPTTAGP